MMRAKSIQFAVVGLGHIGRRHAAMIRRLPEACLVATCDIKAKEALGLEEDDIPHYADLEEMLRREKGIDVVCVCTPNGLHAPQAMLALDYRTHVVVEKPMALNRHDAESIIFKSLNVSKHVFCVMQNRYSPPSRWLKTLMLEERLGEIFMVQVNCYWNRDDRYYLPNGKKHAWKGTNALDGGTLFTQFSHFVDIMYWLFGDVKDIHASFNDYTHAHSTEFEDSGNVTFNFINGGMGVLNYSTAVWGSNLESSLTVIGEKGSIKVGGQYMDKVELCNIEGYEMPILPPSNPANDYGTYKGSANNHGYVFENVIDVLKGRKEITTNALEGMKVVDIIERIYKNK